MIGPVTRTRLRPFAGAVAVVALIIGVAVATVPGGGDASAAVGAVSRYVPVEPCRLTDTRDSAPVEADEQVDIVVAGACGAPADATAASLVITAVEPDGVGYLTVWPTGTDRPATSALNHRGGQTVANSQLVLLGGGAVSVFSLSRTDLVVDVMGYFVVAPEPVAGGRFQPIGPVRALDTRETEQPAAGGTVRVEPVWPAGAVAVTANITTTASSGPGYFTAHPAGSERPNASVLNTDAADQTRSVFSVVPVSDEGFDVYTSAGDHVIVDVTGWFTGDTAEVGEDGLFVGAEPVRLLDTREPYGPRGGPRLWDGGARDIDVAALTGGPVAAIAATVTMTDTEDAGYVVASGARTALPQTSSVNVDGAQATVANSAIVGVSDAGIRVSSLQGTELVVDVTGWFLGEPVVGDGPAAVNAPQPNRRVFVIADSTMAGMRWNGTLDGLQGFEAVTDLESCRRLVAASCRGREGYTPPSLVAELRRLTGITPEDILVIGAGYDDWYGRFSSDFDIVVATARAAGFHHIAWASYVVTDNYLQPGSLSPNYAAMNSVLGAKVASGEFPEVRIWDLDAYVKGTDGWLYADGIHQRPLGSWGVADWISRHVRAFDDRPCVQPWFPGEAVDDPCPNPDTLPVSRGDHPDIVTLYGL
jgi:hypothetical protein